MRSSLNEIEKFLNQENKNSLAKDIWSVVNGIEIDGQALKDALREHVQSEVGDDGEIICHIAFLFQIQEDLTLEFRIVGFQLEEDGKRVTQEGVCNINSITIDCKERFGIRDREIASHLVDFAFLPEVNDISDKFRKDLKACGCTGISVRWIPKYAYLFESNSYSYEQVFSYGINNPTLSRFECFRKRHQ